ncbi:hypothetical protein HYQ40_08225 [Aerococcaceae bacterium DSM 111021]|nr:hypothetical protein [Aerococcaceae bacterium DSM 111021]
MSRVNLYVHYDSVTNHIMTRGINLVHEDFEPRYLPTNMILAQAPPEVGRFDAQTNFKILRNQVEVANYFESSSNAELRMSNWIDFENMESMHQLTANEIAEILYLFHANKGLKSAFFYKLQNNYVFLTLPNGLLKVFYRFVTHFYARFQRVIQARMADLVNESRSLFFMRKEKVNPIPLNIVEQIAPLFSSGLKINFVQAIQTGSYWKVPLNIIEDELTLLTQDQMHKNHVGYIVYDTNAQRWSLELELIEDSEDLDDFDLRSQGIMTSFDET